MKRTVAFIIHHISNVKSGLSHACKAILDNVSEAKAPIQLRDSVHSSTNSQNAGLGFERCCRAGPSSRCTCCSHACSVKPLKHAWHFEVEISELISAPGSCVRKPETKKKHSKGEDSSIPKCFAPRNNVPHITPFNAAEGRSRCRSSSCGSAGWPVQGSGQHIHKVIDIANRCLDCGKDTPPFKATDPNFGRCSRFQRRVRFLQAHLKTKYIRFTWHCLSTCFFQIVVEKTTSCMIFSKVQSCPPKTCLKTLLTCVVVMPWSPNQFVVIE